jgi:hypothetical protein
MPKSKKIAFILLRIEQPEIITSESALLHEIEASISFGKPKAMIVSLIEEADHGDSSD